MKRTLPILGIGLVVSIGAGCPGSDSNKTPQQPTPVQITPSDLQEVTVNMVPDEQTEVEVSEAVPVVTPEGLPHTDPDETVDHLTIARAHLDKGELEEGIDEIERAIFDDPESFEAYFLYGTTREEQGDLQNALWGYNEARAQRGDDLEVLQSIARVEMGLDQVEDAGKTLHELIDLSPESPVGYRLLARTFSKRDMWNECIDANNKAIERGDDSPFTFNNRGYAELVLGHYDDAIESFEQAVTREGATHVMWNNLGIAREKTGSIVDAYAAYEKSLELRPKYVNALVNVERLTRVADASGILLDGHRVAGVDPTPTPVEDEKEMEINDIEVGVEGE